MRTTISAKMPAWDGLNPGWFRKETAAGGRKFLWVQWIIITSGLAFILIGKRGHFLWHLSSKSYISDCTSFQNLGKGDHKLEDGQHLTSLWSIAEWKAGKTSGNRAKGVFICGAKTPGKNERPKICKMC